MELDRYPLHVLQGYQINEGQVARATKLTVDALTNAAGVLVGWLAARRLPNLPDALEKHFRPR
jgi:exopolyphosphatase/guanosine-5'-triphosphate,3'-diphosphate pyrophosphatase